MIRNAVSWTFVLFLLSSRVIKYALIFMDFSYTTRSMSWCAWKCYDEYTLIRYTCTCITYLWLITVTWNLQCLVIVAQEDTKSDNDHSLHDVRYGRILRDGYSLMLIIWQSDMRSWIRTNFWDRSRNNRQTLDLVRVSVEFHQSNAISFKWSDQFSKFQNRWEYDSLLKLSVWIRPRHSSWSVVLVSSLLVASLSLGLSTIQHSMILKSFTSDCHVWSHRVHCVTFLPTLIITIFYHSVSTRPTSIVSSRPLTSVNAMSFLRTSL